MHTNVVDFTELCEDCAIAYEIDKWNWQSVNHIPGIHDNGPRDHDMWRLTLTAYWVTGSTRQLRGLRGYYGVYTWRLLECYHTYTP